jgi:hypothetical protein
MAFPRLRARLLLPALLALASACGDDSSDDAADSAAATSAASTTAAETADDSVGMAGCGDMCGSNDICVIPCACPPPASCFQRPEIGDCGTGTLDVGGANCCANTPDPMACMMLVWCISGPCTPDPPFCAPEDDVICNDDDECEVDDVCMGRLSNELVTCQVCE